MKNKLDDEIDQLDYQIQDLKKKMAELRRSRPREEVKDYLFLDGAGKQVPLSALFGGQRELLIIHNMGSHCPYCTLWADGFNGLYDHLRSRAAFALTSPDGPQEQRDFAAKRGWRFPVYSAKGTTFVDDMGFGGPEGPMPGFSTFLKDGGKLYRVDRAEFGPGDEYCSLWHLFERLPEGVRGWEPRFAY